MRLQMDLRVDFHSWLKIERKNTIISQKSRHIEAMARSSNPGVVFFWAFFGVPQRGQKGLQRGKYLGAKNLKGFPLYYCWKHVQNRKILIFNTSPKLDDLGLTSICRDFWKIMVFFVQFSANCENRPSDPSEVAWSRRKVNLL